MKVGTLEIQSILVHFQELSLGSTGVFGPLLLGKLYSIYTLKHYKLNAQYIQVQALMKVASKVLSLHNQPIRMSQRYHSWALNWNGQKQT